MQSDATLHPMKSEVENAEPMQRETGAARGTDEPTQLVRFVTKQFDYRDWRRRGALRSSFFWGRADGLFL